MFIFLTARTATILGLLRSYLRLCIENLIAIPSKSLTSLNSSDPPLNSTNCISKLGQFMKSFPHYQSSNQSLKPYYCLYLGFTFKFVQKVCMIVPCWIIATLIANSRLVCHSFVCHDWNVKMILLMHISFFKHSWLDLLALRNRVRN